MERFNIQFQCPICGVDSFQTIYYHGDMIRKAKTDCPHGVSVLISFEGTNVIVQSMVSLEHLVSHTMNKSKKRASDKQLLYIKGLINNTRGLNVYNKFMEIQNYNWETLLSYQAVGIISHLKAYSEFKQEWENSYSDYQDFSEKIWLSSIYEFNLGPDQSIMDFGVYYVKNLDKISEMLNKKETGL